MTDMPPLPHLDAGWPEFPAGSVWLVGAGPGDPGLMTLHGLNALRQAEVIVYDALVDRRILDWRGAGVALEYAGKRGGRPSPQQRAISLRLIELAREGRRVLRLKGGDPFVFGRGGEESLALVRAGVPIRITPGISAGIGGLAYAGIPVTHRGVNQVVSFVTGHDATGAVPSAVDWAALAQGSPVIVLYMAMKHLAGIAAQLIAAGRDPAEPVAIVTEATLPGQRRLETTLARAAEEAEAAGLVPPSIICIGRVALLARALDWMAQARGEPPRETDPLGELAATLRGGG
ncbi:uroporphyrinogen-III C-methyltransferase [Paralimibaculum aggregatum]|uniref:uroporphyrinogen-III C-methyltransferase n=1 Tax=Paralimibaculum aggregatum TaxID=3036245 RepID=A0ABQ6LN65_9RHOB|nr:uroporphyrinogen-III C-methyltransferase [Limibaculum sp. NKW23]GMG81715.1 uroporphyrinogen-III C-methyltransferase [Limibaculum sp. NKW23]